MSIPLYQEEWQGRDYPDSQNNLMSNNLKGYENAGFLWNFIRYCREHNWYYSELLVQQSIEANNNSVYGSSDNFLCNTNFTMTSKYEPCKNYLKTIIMSSPAYWRKGIELSKYKDSVDSMMNNLNNHIWIANREIPYSRDLNTDPESWAPNKQNPFDSDHLPRIYVSLGTSSQKHPEIFKAIMRVLGKKNYPVDIATGNLDWLYNDLNEYKEQNSYNNITLWMYAPQQEI